MFIRKIFSAINSDPEDDLEDNGTAVAVATAKPKLKKPYILNQNPTPQAEPDILSSTSHFKPTPTA